MNLNQTTMATDDDTRKATAIDREFLSLTGKVAKRFPAPVFFILVVIAFFAYEEANRIWVVLWLLFASAMLFGRIVGINKIIANNKINDKQKINWICLLNAGNGIFLGLSLVFFPYLSAIERVFQTLLFTGMCASVVASNFGLIRAILPYLLFTLIPLAIVWVVFADSNEALWKFYLFAFTILLYIAILISIARGYFGFFESSVEMRLKNTAINKQLEKALNESKASNAAKTRFLATASHDLRQPVHTLSLLTAALMSRQLESKTAQISKNMDMSLQGLARQLDALLDISKLDAGIVVPQWSEVSVTKMLEGLNNQFLPLAQAKNLTLIVNTSSSCFTYSDPTLLEQIIHNLIANAIKYTDEGEITVDVKTDKENLIIAIADTGVGIAETEQELVFEEFYQLSNPHRDRAKGLGLGLSIVRRLTLLLDIKLRMESAEGKGTEFILELPLSDKQSQGNTETHKQVISFDNISVLVIDDEEAIQKATQLYLESLNCKVMLADNSAAGIELANHHKPDLLIVDYRLRDNDSGLVAIEGIRKRYSDLPVIIITGDTAPDRLQEASKVHATLLYKPIDIDALKLAMQKELDV